MGNVIGELPARPDSTPAVRHIFPRQTAHYDQSGQLNPVVVRGVGACPSMPLAGAFLIAFLLAACQHATGDYCDVAKPIRLSHATVAVMSDAEVAAVLSENRKGESLCHWKAQVAS